MRLVKAFSDDEYEIGISNLARRLALPKSTVHRLATTLVDAGFLEQNPETGGYRLGLALFDLGMDGIDVPPGADPQQIALGITHNF